MMERLVARAEQIGRAAQSQRLQQIAAQLGERGLKAQSDGESVAFRAPGLARKWLSDPLLRFLSARPA